MKWLFYIFSSLWRLWFFSVFLITFFICMPFLFVFSTVYKNPKFVSYITRYWSKVTLYLSFIFPKQEWEEKINKNDIFIFCPNHTSTLDIPFLFSIIPCRMQFIGKAELARIPVFGYFFKKNSVIVDRKNRKDSYLAFLKAKEKLDEGINMCIFPEGGIPKSNVKLKKFKNGPFKLAFENNIKIIPITIPDNKYIFPQSYFKGGPGLARIKIHKAIDPNSLTKKSVENLNTLVYNTIFEQLKYYERK